MRERALDYMLREASAAEAQAKRQKREHARGPLRNAR